MRDCINKKSIYKNTNKKFLIIKEKKIQAQTIKYKELFYLSLLIGGVIKWEKIRMIGIGR